MTGFEPAISALTGQRVWPLHYTPEPAKSTIALFQAARIALAIPSITRSIAASSIQ